MYRCRRANGMCGQCGKVPSNTAYCKTCAEKRATHKKASYKRKRESGRCTQCSKTHEGEGILCATCKGKKGEYTKNRYKRKRDSNKCRDCQISCEGEGVRCDSCAKTHRESMRERDKPCRDVWIAWKHKTCACGCSDWRVIGASNPKGRRFSDYCWWTSNGGAEALEAALVSATPICRNCRRTTKERSRRRWVREEKERRKSCAFCGLVGDPRIYEFDHIGTKEFEVHKAKTKKAFVKEVEKCQMLCANCHHLKTHYIADVK